MSVLPIGMSGEAGAYQITRSLRFNSADSAYLNRTPASTGNRRTYSHSFWLKRGDISRLQWVFSVRQASGSSNFFYEGIFYGDDTFSVQLRDGSGNEVGNIRTTQVFRDVSAWYHFLVVIDTTQATSSNRMKLYVNGSQVTAFGTATYPTQNFDSGANVSTYPFFHGNFVSSVSSTYNYSGYLADVHFIDGSALTPSSFGETDTTTGVWKPKQYTGSYGTNGFNLKFADNSGTTSTTLGKDSSSNGNNYTPNNFSVTAGAGNDSLVDTPTPYGTDTGVGGEVRGNYATLNPLDNALTLANGNLQFDRATTSWASTRATAGITSGKWYWEVTPTTVSGTLFCMVGVALNSATLSNYFATSATGWAYSAHDGGKYNNATYGAYGATWTTNDVIGIAFDADAGTLTFYKNNVSQGTAYTGLTSGPYIPAVSLYGTHTAYINFGQRPFAYTAPSGFKALCTQNLPTPTVVQGDDYFNTVLFTGTGSAQSITGVGFQPDFVWQKARAETANHRLVDSVRGVDKVLYSSSTSAEATTDGVVDSFNSDGYTGGGLDVVSSGLGAVAWNWKANGSGVTNTAGTITSTVSANTTSGFSIVTYLNASGTVGHGLGVAPKMIIYKDRDNGSNNWVVTHTSLATMNNDYLVLNTTGAAASGLGLSANPTSTVFSTSTALGGSGNKFVAYCFAPVAGYSAFGSYTGNGSADGPFVFTNFRPAFVLIKNSSNTGGVSWQIKDNERIGYNPSNTTLYPNLSNAEYSDAGNFEIDFLSNGFKIRTSTDAGTNASGNTYIYAAFASNPFKFSLGA
jgi:hypothetical protein